MAAFAKSLGAAIDPCRPWRGCWPVSTLQRKDPAEEGLNSPCGASSNIPVFPGELQRSTGSVEPSFSLLRCQHF